MKSKHFVKKPAFITAVPTAFALILVFAVPSFAATAFVASSDASEVFSAPSYADNPAGSYSEYSVPEYSVPDYSMAAHPGWFASSGSWYYMDENGVLQTGWLFDGSDWYYLDADGAMLTGWINFDDSWYFFDYSGRMLTGWQTINGSEYFFDETGCAVSGWLWDGGYWYYFDEASEMASGWQMIDDEWYYFVPDSGHMAYDCWVLDDDGKPSYIGSDGVLSGRSLTWIGDSISTFENGRNAIYALFDDVTINSQAQRCILEDQYDNPAGLTVVREMADEGLISDYVVFQMGTNIDEHYPAVSTTEKINELISIIGSDKKIILVTAYVTNDWCTNYYYGTINEEMRQIAASNPNVAVADWAAVCNPYTDLVDYAHPSEYGGYKYMSLIRDTLLWDFGPQ